MASEPSYPDLPAGPNQPVLRRGRQALILRAPLVRRDQEINPNPPKMCALASTNREHPAFFNGFSKEIQVPTGSGEYAWVFAFSTAPQADFRRAKPPPATILLELKAALNVRARTRPPARQICEDHGRDWQVQNDSAGPGSFLIPRQNQATGRFEYKSH